jgi:hypothetical protein
MERTDVIQAGGVAVITTSKLTPRCSDGGGDPSGLGRWAWTRIEGSGNRNIRLILVYRPCHPTGNGPGTVHAQHHRFFGGEDLQPRQVLLDDLEQAIIEWKDQ